MKTVREMFVSLTTMLINHIWASIIEICVEKWRTQSLKKIEIQMSRHEKRYRSEEMAPVVSKYWTHLPFQFSRVELHSISLTWLTLRTVIICWSQRRNNMLLLDRLYLKAEARGDEFHIRRGSLTSTPPTIIFKFALWETHNNVSASLNLRNEF